MFPFRSRMKRMKSATPTTTKIHGITSSQGESQTRTPSHVAHGEAQNAAPPRPRGETPTVYEEYSGCRPVPQSRRLDRR